MKLTTKCPKCSTVFDVSLDTLQQRKGYTRCVNCAHIFDGFEEVLPENNTSAQSHQTIQSQQPKPQDLTTNNQASHNIGIAPIQTQPQKTDNDFIIRTRTADDNKPPLESNHKISDLEQKQTVDFGKEFTISDAPQTDVHSNHSIGDTVVDDTDYVYSLDNIEPTSNEDDYDEEYVDIGSRFISVLWIVLIAISVAVFLLQMVYVFRVQIAEHMPQTRPRLQAFCEKIGCNMPWPRKPEHILIVHSSLQSQTNLNKDEDVTGGENEESSEQSTAEQSSEYVLQVLLRNTYEQAQEWPSLILELTDAAGAKIARKNIAAQQYLPTDYINSPFQASSEYQVQLPIKLQGLKVNGYQVTTFFP